MNTANDVVILDASALDPSKELPAGLEGLPTFAEIDDENVVGQKADGSPIFGKRQVPIAYYSKEVARTPTPGKLWAHRGRSHALGDLEEFSLTSADFDDTVRNFDERQKAGIKPFIPDSHVESRDAAANNGEVLSLSKRPNADGTHSLLAKLKIVGEAGQRKVLNNDVSVYLVDGNDKLVVDAAGKRYKGRVLHHIALTPNPALPHLEPFKRIAASADGADMRDVPVFRYVPRLALGDKPMCTPEEMAAAKEHLTSMGEDASDVTPDNAMSKVIAHGKKAKAAADDARAAATTMAAKHKAAQAVMSLAADAELEPAIKSLMVERDRLKTDLTAKTVALSADDPANLRPIDLSAFEINADTMWEHAIKSGAISSAGAITIKKLVRDKNGRPSRIGLSASGENNHPFEYNLARLIAGLTDPIKVGTAAPRDTTVADPAVALDATAAREGHPQPEVRRESVMEEARKITGAPKPTAAA